MVGGRALRLAKKRLKRRKNRQQVYHVKIEDCATMTSFIIIAIITKIRTILMINRRIMII